MTEKILSVGIDLGTSTTQLVLSELFIENMASAFSIPRIVISDKKVIYKSDIRFTPILADNLIDVEEIKQFVEEQYRKAGIQKEEIQMGAVIITGETARKENASKVLTALSDLLVILLLRLQVLIWKVLLLVKVLVLTHTQRKIGCPL